MSRPEAVTAGAATDDHPRAAYLSDLPVRRRRDVARFIASEQDYDLVRRIIGRCMHRPARFDAAAIDGARLGSDGLYHLASGDSPICSNGRSMRQHPRSDRAGTMRISLEGAVREPASIPTQERCAERVRRSGPASSTPRATRSPGPDECSPISSAPPA